MDNYVEGYDIVIDTQGNRYIAGTVAGSVDLDPATVHPGDVDIVASNGWGFLAKYDSAGAFQWARQGVASPAGSSLYIV